VNIHIDILLGIFGCEQQELCCNTVSELVIDRGAEEHDAVLQQPGVDVIRSLAACGLLDNIRNECAHCTNPPFQFVCVQHVDEGEEEEDTARVSGENNASSAYLNQTFIRLLHAIRP